MRSISYKCDRGEMKLCYFNFAIKGTFVFVGFLVNPTSNVLVMPVGC